MRFYFSAQDTLSPAIVGVVCVFVHVGIVVALHNSMQHSSIALATLVSKTAKVLVLYLLLKPKLGDLRIGENIVFGLRLLLAAAGMAIVVQSVHAGLLHVLPPVAGGTRGIASGLIAARIGIASMAGLLVFSGAVIAMRMPEVQAMRSFVRRR
jgi:putative peptidoglycan lipid II flippase